MGVLNNMSDPPAEFSPPLVSRRRRRFVLPAVLIILLIALPLIWLGLEIGKRRSQHALIQQIEASGGVVHFGLREEFAESWQGK